MEEWTIIGSSITFYMEAIPGVVNQSIRGLTTAKLLRLLSDEECHLSVNFKNILFYIGSNDCTTHPKKKTPPANFEDIIKNISDITDLVKSKNPKVNIHFYELAPRFSCYDECCRAIKRLNRHFRGLSEKKTIKAGRVTNKRGKPQKEHYAPDGIHLSKGALVKLRNITIKFIKNHK